MMNPPNTAISAGRFIALAGVTTIMLSCGSTPPEDSQDGQPGAQSNAGVRNLRCNDPDADPGRRLSTSDEIRSRISEEFGIDILRGNEPHDCQRLIRTDAQRSPLVTVWVSEKLEDPNYSVEQLVAGVSLQDGDPYDGLNLKKLKNCLWLTKGMTNTWTARMVPIEDHQKCSVDGANSSLERTLDVVPKPQQSLGGNKKYPVAGRLLENRNGYLIGLQCEKDTWCMIGPDAETADVPNDARGDSQRLHYMKNGVPVPSTLIGTLRPFPYLEDIQDETVFHDVWVPIAVITISGSDEEAEEQYIRKWNLPAADEMPRTIPVEIMVRPNQNPDKTKYYMRFGQQGGGRKITPMKATGHHPGTVRWRWSESDEGLWVPCPAGCCGDN
jgi:hypothetical protein